MPNPEIKTAFKPRPAEHHDAPSFASTEPPKRKGLPGRLRRRLAPVLLSLSLASAQLAACSAERQNNETAGLSTPSGIVTPENTLPEPTPQPPVITTPTQEAADTVNPESQPSPTPQMIEITSLDDTPATSEQQMILTTMFETLITNQIVSGDNEYIGRELNGALWIEDSQPGNPTLNIGYGRTVTDNNGIKIIPAENDVVKIFADPDLADGYFIGRVSEINNSLIQYGLIPDVVNFNIGPDGKLQGVNDEGDTLATRFKFEKEDGSVVAIFVPTGAEVSTDKYILDGNLYRFDKNSGQFSQEAITTPTPQPAQGEIKQTRDGIYEQFDGNEWNIITTEPEVIYNDETQAAVFSYFDPETMEIKQIALNEGEGFIPFGDLMVEGVRLDSNKAKEALDIYLQAIYQNPLNKAWVNDNGYLSGTDIAARASMKINENGPNMLLVGQSNGLLKSIQSPMTYMHNSSHPISNIDTTKAFYITYDTEQWRDNPTLRKVVEFIEQNSSGRSMNFGGDDDEPNLTSGTYILPIGETGTGVIVRIIGSRNNGNYNKQATLNSDPNKSAADKAQILNVANAAEVLALVNFYDFQSSAGGSAPYYIIPYSDVIPSGVDEDSLDWNGNPSVISPGKPTGYDPDAMTIFTPFDN